MQHVERQTLLGYLSLSLAAAIWGGMYVVSKIALASIPPFTLLWLRYAVGCLVLFAMVSRSGLLLPLTENWRGFALIGLVGYLISVGLQFVGTKLSTASMGSVITSASPAFIVIFARSMLGEPFTLRKLLSILAASAGVVIVVGLDQGTGGSTVLLGNLALVGAAVTWALLSILAKRAATAYPPLVITCYAIFWAVIFCTPVMLLEWCWLPVRGLTSPHLWLAVLYIGVVSTAGAFYLWNKGMQLVEAGSGSVFFFLQPVVGSLCGWLFLGERLSSAFFIGGGLILLAVLIVSLPAGKRTT